MKKLIILLLLAACADAWTIQSGVNFQIGNTRYTIDHAYTSSNIILYNDVLSLAVGNISATSNTTLNVNISAHTAVYHNYTATPANTGYINYTLSGFTADLNYHIQKDGVEVVSDTVPATGTITYDSPVIDTSTNYIFKTHVCRIPAGVRMIQETIGTNDGTLRINVTSTGIHDINCVFPSLDNECNWGATNVTAIIFPVANITADPFTTCNLTFQTKYTQGTYSIYASESQDYNQTNLGNINYTKTKYIRKYISWW